MAQFSATTPAILLDQVGRMPFSNYVIQSNETSVTGAIASSCVQLPEALSSVVVHHCGILCLPLQCSMVFGLWNELFYNVNTISQMQITANAIRSYTRKLKYCS